LSNKKIQNIFKKTQLNSEIGLSFDLVPYLKRAITKAAFKRHGNLQYCNEKLKIICNCLQMIICLKYAITEILLHHYFLKPNFTVTTVTQKTVLFE
jgi:hypothetical protein